MDQQLIYRKTVLGEEAIQSRAKLSEHELRVILIMVDGKKTVGEMITKFGNLHSVEQALYRLERDGYIRPIAGFASDLEIEQSNDQLEALFVQKNSGTKSARVAVPDIGSAESRAAGSDEGGGFQIPVIDIPPMPSDDEILAGGSAAAKQQPKKPGADAGAAPPKAPRPATPSAAAVAASPAVSAPVPPVSPGRRDQAPSSWDEEDDPLSGLQVPPMLDVDDVRRHAERSGGRLPISPVEKAEEKPGGKLNPFSVGGPATAGGFEKAWPKEEAAPAPAPKEPLIPFQLPRRRRGLGKMLLIALVALLLTPVVLFIVYPFDNHRADLESMLTQSLGQPVKLARLHASLSPSPAFVLDRVVVGTGGEVTVREVRAMPDLLSFFGERLRFNEIQVNGLRVPVERLGMLSGATAGLGSASTIGVRSLRFSRVTLVAKDLELADYSGRAQIDDEGRLRLLSLSNGDGTLDVSVVGDAAGSAQVLAEGEGWKPSSESPFVFEWVKMAGRIDGNSLVTERIEGRLFGGVVKGSLRFSWGERMALATDITSEFMKTPILLTALRVPAIIEGQIDGRVRFDVEAESWSKLVGSVPMAGEFLATKGNLNGMDLVEAVRRAGQPAYRGGGTKFDSLRGRFAWDGKTLRLSQIDLSSGIVGAYGQAQIGSDGAISGDVDVLIKASNSRTREPVRVSGTLKEPLLTAGR